MYSNNLLTPEEVAAALGIGRTKVYELLSRGAISSVQIGRSRRITRNALDTYISDLVETRPGSPLDEQ